MTAMRSALVGLLLVGALAGAGCVPNPGGGSGGTTISYNGPRGNCENSKTVNGAKVSLCQGLANGTTSVIVNTKVKDPACPDLLGYHAVGAVAGTATQGATTKALTQTLATPGEPVYDTGFNVDNGKITVKLTTLTVASALSCGWFGVHA